MRITNTISIIFGLNIFAYLIFFISEGTSNSESVVLLLLLLLLLFFDETVLLLLLCSDFICWSFVCGVPGSLSFLCFRFQQSGLTFIRSSAISLAKRANSSRFSSDNSRQRSPSNLLIALLLLKGIEKKDLWKKWKIGIGLEVSKITENDSKKTLEYPGFHFTMDKNPYFNSREKN